jgi:hypothetical protein
LDGRAEVTEYRDDAAEVVLRSVESQLYEDAPKLGATDQGGGSIEPVIIAEAAAPIQIVAPYAGAGFLACQVAR